MFPMHLNVLYGTWGISTLVESNWTDVMLVFKGGQGGPIVPDNYVSYLVDATSSNWVAPFALLKTVIISIQPAYLTLVSIIEK